VIRHWLLFQRPNYHSTGTDDNESADDESALEVHHTAWTLNFPGTSSCACCESVSLPWVQVRRALNQRSGGIDDVDKLFKLLNIVVGVAFKLFKLLNIVVDVVFKLLIDNVELVDKLFKLLNIVVESMLMYYLNY
jgi:hypothetical protein